MVKRIRRVGLIPLVIGNCSACIHVNLVPGLVVVDVDLLRDASNRKRQSAKRGSIVLRFEKKKAAQISLRRNFCAGCQTNLFVAFNGSQFGVFPVKPIAVIFHDSFQCLFGLDLLQASAAGVSQVELQRTGVGRRCGFIGQTNINGNDSGKRQVGVKPFQRLISIENCCCGNQTLLAAGKILCGRTCG